MPKKKKGLKMQKLKKRQGLHEPVLVKEAMEALGLEDSVHLNKEKKFIDATLGLAGHSIEIIKRGGKVLGIEADNKSLEIAKNEVRSACPPHLLKKVGSIAFVHGNFRDIDFIAKSHGFGKVNGVLFDLGISSYQIEKSKRGFSFKENLANLDMRLDKVDQLVTAADLLNSLPKGKLYELFSVTVPATESKKLAERIVRHRNEASFKTVGDFLEVMGKVKRGSRLNEATLPFLAIRIAVNSELENLSVALAKSVGLLKNRGRLVVISFHSGEDRIVKRFFKSQSDGRVVNKKPYVAGAYELDSNLRARSAKLRIFEKN